MNTGKTKVMFSCSMKDRVEEKGKWPCGVCKKGVHNNSILCYGCKKWIHKRYSRVKGSLFKASQSFICRCCKVDRPITDGLNTDLHLDNGNEVLLEKVIKFRYLGDVLDADGGCDSAVTARQSCLEKISRILTLSNWKRILVKKQKGKVYATCVKSCLMHGSETWPMKVEHELKLNRTEMSTIRWMCGVKLNERYKSEELRELLGLEPVSLMIKKSRLRWFRLVERKDDNDWVKRCITWDVEGIRQRGCLKKTW